MKGQKKITRRGGSKRKKYSKIIIGLRKNVTLRKIKAVVGDQKTKS